ncbi:uncharacterized protein LY79DRAFT_18594 [Colletotrichum navitas]|uniref:Uncharacterized protein n=1 Tax=Colletotrichum navitas TaxID=681940 RepID=A0AAD8VCS5_9PEZI|nr:uncharacterized protein LY79DRAFT_18594 [Colletotrichum navitas]KAK1600423.1 hypothetical protein LY79DRAFT_18594 [Colletotrichum navitas]
MIQADVSFFPFPFCQSPTVLGISSSGVVIPVAGSIGAVLQLCPALPKPGYPRGQPQVSEEKASSDLRRCFLDQPSRDVQVNIDGVLGKDLRVFGWLAQDFERRRYPTSFCDDWAIARSIFITEGGEGAWGRWLKAAAGHLAGEISLGHPQFDQAWCALLCRQRTVAVAGEGHPLPTGWRGQGRMCILRSIWQIGSDMK